MSKDTEKTLKPTSLDDCIIYLEELQGALEREEVELARRFLSHLVSHTAWLSDFDEVFESLDGKEPDVDGCLRWARWQLGNLRLELVIDGDDEEVGNSRETKPYPQTVQSELVASSVRSTSENQALRPKTGNHSTLIEDTESSIAQDSLKTVDELDAIEDLIEELIEPSET